MKTLALFAAAGVLVACQDATPPAPPAPSLALADAGAGALPGQYIVVLREDVRDVPGTARRLAAAYGGTLRFVYTHAIKGFAVSNLPDAAAAALARQAVVAYVEPDREMHAIATQRMDAGGNPWGLDRIDQRAKPMDLAYSYGATGAGVTAYIIDTGIRASHTEFGGRATVGYDAVGDGRNGEDCNGHGTHVAGTVGGTTYGVAKSVSIVAVRVLNCNGSGTTSGVVAGVDWVTQNHAASAVANMSLGGGASTALDDAVANSIASGVAYAIAAGNGDILGRPIDACTQSPARVASAITVGATDSTDHEASFSNYGTCVDLLAPGVRIVSAWNGTDTQLDTISGTSMATPHTTGAAALYLEMNPGAAPGQVASALTTNATSDVLVLNSTTRGTPNRLLYMGFIGGTPGNAAPLSSFSATCSALTCQFTDASSDADGSVVGWQWDFGDGSSSTEQSPSHTYAAGGSFTVRQTVSDDQGATGSSSQAVTVSDPNASVAPSDLAATGTKVKGRQRVDLRWTPGSASAVDIVRDGAVIQAGGANTGAYTDNIGARGGGSYTYRVCIAGGGACSNTSTVTF